MISGSDNSIRFYYDYVHILRKVHVAFANILIVDLKKVLWLHIFVVYTLFVEIFFS